MKFISQSATIWQNTREDEMVEKLSHVVGTPYAKGFFEADKAKKVIESCVRRGHESVLEHVSITLMCITNIETYKDYTRHRHCAFTIESTSFVKYPELTLIVTPEIKENLDVKAMEQYEAFYKEILEKYGAKKARDLLPQSQAARMFMTTNIRQWRYILGLRTDPNDNPLTNELCLLMWDKLTEYCPFFFPANGADVPMAIKQLWRK